MQFQYERAAQEQRPAGDPAAGDDADVLPLRPQGGAETLDDARIPRRAGAGFQADDGPREGGQGGVDVVLVAAPGGAAGRHLLGQEEPFEAGHDEAERDVGGRQGREAARVHERVGGLAAQRLAQTLADGREALNQMENAGGHGGHLADAHAQDRGEEQPLQGQDAHGTDRPEDARHAVTQRVGVERVAGTVFPGRFRRQQPGHGRQDVIQPDARVVVSDMHLRSQQADACPDAEDLFQVLDEPGTQRRVAVQPAHRDAVLAQTLFFR